MMTSPETPAARPVVFGEVLYDRFPDGVSVLGGAPFNVAWNLKALGLDPLFISAVGDDAPGHGILDAMNAWGMDTGGVQIDPRHPTGEVRVKFIGGEPRYDIVQDRAYDFIDPGRFPTLPSHGLLYHGSLAARNQASLRALDELRAHWRGHRFVDINLRAPHWTAAACRSLIQGADSLKLNEAELIELGGKDDPQGLQRFLLDHRLGALIITRGAAGAEIINRDGLHIRIRERPVATVVDSVGAGDAFSTILILGRLRGWSIQDRIHNAHRFAAKVLTLRGATTMDADFYGETLYTGRG